MTRYRAAFLWDCYGTSTTLWIRTCDLPPGVGPHTVLERGIWVAERHRTPDHPFREGPIDYLSEGSAGAVWIPPGRITSIIIIT